MNPSRSLEMLSRDCAEIERLLPLAALRAEQVSAWSIGEQIEHAITVTESILHGLESGTITERPRPLSFLGRIVLFLGFIPRGRAMTPERLRPVGMDSSALTERLSALRKRLAPLAADPAVLLRSQAKVNHPYFGTLNPAQWIRFMAVHQRHHLKIMRDIASRMVSAPR